MNPVSVRASIYRFSMFFVKVVTNVYGTVWSVLFVEIIKHSLES